MLGCPSTTGSPRPGTARSSAILESGLSGQTGAGAAILETGLSTNQREGDVQTASGHYTDKLCLNGSADRWWELNHYEWTLKPVFSGSSDLM